MGSSLKKPLKKLSIFINEMMNYGQFAIICLSYKRMKCNCLVITQQHRQLFHIITAYAPYVTTITHLLLSSLQIIISGFTSSSLASTLPPSSAIMAYFLCNCSQYIAIPSTSYQAHPHSAIPSHSIFFLNIINHLMPTSRTFALQTIHPYLSPLSG